MKHFHNINATDDVKHHTIIISLYYTKERQLVACVSSASTSSSSSSSTSSIHSVTLFYCTFTILTNIYYNNVFIITIYDTKLNVP